MFFRPSGRGTRASCASNFTSLLAANNATVQYDSNPRLSIGQKLNFAPRVGFALQLDPRTVIRAGAGVFYGATFGLGSNPNIGGNYPFMIHSGLGATTCVNGNATNQSGITTYCPSLSPTTAASSVGTRATWLGAKLSDLWPLPESRTIPSKSA